MAKEHNKERSDSQIPPSANAPDFRVIFEELQRANEKLQNANQTLRSEVERRRRTEALLHETSALHAAIFHSMDRSIISTTLDGTILTFNAGAERLLGYDAIEIVNKSTPMIFHDPEEITRRAREL